GRAMAGAARRFDRVVQVGLQRRSSAFVREAAELVRGGAIGKVTVVRSFHIQNEWPKGIDAPPDEPPPTDFDWEGWLGPAPKRPSRSPRWAASSPSRTTVRYRTRSRSSGSIRAAPS